MHRAVIDALVPLRETISKLRSLLKSIRVCLKARDAFRTTQVLLGRESIRDVPNLDIETR